MAYDKHTWTCREPITAEKLNHMEDGIANAGGDCDCGYECTEALTTLTEEIVTTATDGDFNVGTLSYSQLIDADTLIVTFDGVEYECEVDYVDGEYYYGALYDDNLGAYDWSEYPFVIGSYSTPLGVRNGLITQAEGTYGVKIEAEETIVTTTPCFDKARGYSCEEETVTLTEESVTTTMEEGATKAYGNPSYSQLIDTDSITVTFDGVEYECPRTTENNSHYYGAPYDDSTDNYDWSEYPFAIVSSTQFGNDIVTETAGTYSIKIEAMQETVTTTECFQKAVESLRSPLFVPLTRKIQDATLASPTETPEGSQSDIINALEGGRMVYLVEPNGHKCLVIGYSSEIPNIEVMGDSSRITFETDVNKFYYPTK